MFTFFMLVVMVAAGVVLYLGFKESFKLEQVEREVVSQKTDDLVDRIKEALNKTEEK